MAADSNHTIIEKMHMIRVSQSPSFAELQEFDLGWKSGAFTGKIAYASIG